MGDLHKNLLIAFLLVRTPILVLMAGKQVRARRADQLGAPRSSCGSSSPGVRGIVSCSCPL